MIGRVRRAPTDARLISTLVAVLVAGGLLLAPAATAAASTYHGHIKGVPGGRFDLRFSRIGGRLFLNAIEDANTPVDCDNGPTILEGNMQFPPTSESRVRRGAFDVRQDNGNGDFQHVAGELERRGKAVGTFKERITLGPPQGVCTTGKLEWVAKKL